MQVTFDEYDEILSRFEHMQSETFWPSKEQIDMFEKNPKKWLLFACYLYEKGKEPNDNFERYSKRNLKNFINKHLKIVDNHTD